MSRRDQRFSNDDQDFGLQPLIEMSQDCVVEWNESQSTPLPAARQLESDTKSPPNSDERRRSIGLASVRRQLESQQQQERQSRNDEEIDAIFNLLAKEGVASPTRSTPRSGNEQSRHTDSSSSVAALVQNDHDRRSLTSLASRRRRRQQRAPADQNLSSASSKRTKTERPQSSLHRNQLDSSKSSSALQTPPPSDRSEGFFGSLLKQMKEPANDDDEEEDKKGATFTLPSTNKENPYRPQPDVPKATTNSQANNLSQQLYDKARQPLVTVQDMRGKAEMDTDSKLSFSGSRKTPETEEVNMTATSSQSTTVVTNITNIANAEPISGLKGENDDEFDVFFSIVDMDSLDQLLAAKSSQAIQTQMQSSLSTASKKNSTKDPSALVKQVTTIREHLPSHDSKPESLAIDAKGVSTLSQHPVVEDEFGEFPDIDFDIMDQAISNASCHSKRNPLTEERVQNMRCRDEVSSLASDLSFIKFFRYHVLQVDVDLRMFHKTILVSEWEEESLKQEEKKIQNTHRHSAIQVVEANSNDSLWSANCATVTNYSTNDKKKKTGHIQLRGQWYYTAVEAGDTIHLCSLTGKYRTDPGALPIVLHSHPPAGDEQDDLVIVHHPDLLMTPTVVSETVSCPRRAVLKQRNGSAGLSSKSALIGTLRHALFGWCMKEQNFDRSFVQRQVQKIVRENAEAMLGCDVTTEEAEGALMETLPILQDFVQEYTTFSPRNNSQNNPEAFVHGHIGVEKGIRFAAHATYSIEEPVISPELALKGYVDAVLETTIAEAGNSKSPNQYTITGLKHSLMALELKTGHNQTSQHTHMGQLSLYTLMLQGRYGTKSGQQAMMGSKAIDGSKPDPKGSAAGGLLLYLNQQSFNATHVAPEYDELKSLIGQRNIIASDFLTASKPRGVTLSYQDDQSDDEITQQILLHEPAPPVKLPEMQASERPCSRCFENRSCMLYARSETEQEDKTGVRRTHADLLAKFTGQLHADDIQYFRKWDRLIDLEAHATTGNTAAAWLLNSHARERSTGETISALVYDGASPRQGGTGVLLRFKRSPLSASQTSLDSLSIPSGSHVVISTDGNVLEDSQSDPRLEYVNTQLERKKFRHQMGVVRGFLDSSTATEVLISATRDDLDRIRVMCNRFDKFATDGDDSMLMFRLDKENSSVGIGTLRQNLINFFTADRNSISKEGPNPIEIARQKRLPRLRNFVVRLEQPKFGSLQGDRWLFDRWGPALPGCEHQKLSEEFRLLNQDQQNAVRKVLASEDYAIIQGLPGTGKTSTLSFIARLLAARGKRVLITSYTNSAVDNVVIKLAESGVCAPNVSTGFSSVVRVGPRHSCHVTARSVHINDIASQLEVVTSNDRNNGLSQGTGPHGLSLSVESLRRVISHARIVCTTVLTVPRSPLLVNGSFDIVIVDEAGQTSQPAVLGALMAADSFVLVGDHKQLPPLVSSEIAQAGGYGESLLMRLAEKHTSAVAALTYQYRMNEEICKLSSYLIYGGLLKCGNETVRSRRLVLPGFPSSLPPVGDKKGLWSWLKMVINPDKPVIFVDTDNIRGEGKSASEKAEVEALEVKKGGRAGGKVTNPTEADLARYIIHGLISTGASPQQIGVISPFRAQVELMDGNSAMNGWKQSGLEISTIDRYQGRDKSAIILSFVRSNSDGNAGRLLQDKRRLNVALTRAKEKLIILGSYSTLKKGSMPLRPLLGRINTNDQRVLLPENAMSCYQLS